jgi:hypothetical protein
VADDLLDEALLLEIFHGEARERAVDLQSIDQDGDGDETVGLDILLQLVGGGLVEDDGVVGLVLDCGGSASASNQAAGSAPFPLDHFFFAFFPVAAGA